MLALLLLVNIPSGSLQAEEEGREYAVKAVFLYNFCQFIEWPRQQFPSANTPFVIGILGSNPFGSLLSETVQGEVVRGRSIRLEYYQRPADAHNCHILFVSDEELARNPNVCAVLRGQSVVTVGESDAFLERGGMIALASEQNRIRVRIYLEAVGASKIEISSKLLRIADIKR
ncbi:YfiR family protein [Prosthecobacter fusiformis]|uniref:YfiR family protein n=1 Tax=Prosthecobacter fusiformis TaxID=48464 RepID=UPI0014151CC6|nr:YfiR family protein [Prosthecobacter fusiformis]